MNSLSMSSLVVPCYLFEIFYQPNRNLQVNGMETGLVDIYSVVCMEFDEFICLTFWELSLNTFFSL